MESSPEPCSNKKTERATAIAFPEDKYSFAEEHRVESRMYLRLRPPSNSTIISTKAEIEVYMGRASLRALYYSKGWGIGWSTCYESECGAIIEDSTGVTVRVQGTRVWGVVVVVNEFENWRWSADDGGRPKMGSS